MAVALADHNLNLRSRAAGSTPRWVAQSGLAAPRPRSDRELLVAAAELPLAHQDRGRPFDALPVLCSSARLSGNAATQAAGWDPEISVRWHIGVGSDEHDQPVFSLWKTRHKPDGSTSYSSWESGTRLRSVLRALNGHLQAALRDGYQPDLTSGPVTVTRPLVLAYVDNYPLLT